MLTDESEFALQQDNKREMVWRGQGARNRPQKTTVHLTLEMAASRYGQGFR